MFHYYFRRESSSVISQKVEKGVTIRYSTIDVVRIIGRLQNNLFHAIYDETAMPVCGEVRCR